MSTPAEMYVQGESADMLSERKVTKLAENLCGHDFSHTTISNMVAELDEALQAFASGRLDDPALPYLMMNARYENGQARFGAVRCRSPRGVDPMGEVTCWQRNWRTGKAKHLSHVSVRLGGTRHERRRQVLPMALWL